MLRASSVPGMQHALTILRGNAQQSSCLFIFNLRIISVLTCSRRTCGRRLEKMQREHAEEIGRMHERLRASNSQRPFDPFIIHCAMVKVFSRP